MKTTTIITDIYQAKSQVKEASSPLYASQPDAGFPAPGDDMVERSLNLNELLIRRHDSTFFVRVSGDSMEGAKIFSGDILVVDRSLEAKTGRIVVAAVFGEMVVKKLGMIDGKTALLSASPGYEPIFVNDTDECYVWGVVTGSARELL